MKFPFNKLCDFSFQQRFFFELQHYYPNFLESGIYLKFLDDLLRMVKSAPDLSVENSAQNTTSTSDDASHTETKPIHFLTYSVDDPDSLWRQAPLLYVVYILVSEYRPRCKL